MVHNDAKAGNVLLDAATGEPVAVIDLDTVMMGTLLHDVGDLIRSGATHAAEDAAAGRRRWRWTWRSSPRWWRGSRRAWPRSGWRPGSADASWRPGWSSPSSRGSGSLADHLAGDRYYRIQRPGQNLDRARVRFRLGARIGQGRRELSERIVAAVFGG